MAASARKRARLLERVDADAARLERERVPYALAWAAQLRGGAAALRDEARAAEGHLAHAIVGFTRADMALEAAVTRARLAERTGGDEGEAALDWLRAQGCAHPRRIVRMALPLA
jgi:hypothetical protein